MFAPVGYFIDRKARRRFERALNVAARAISVPPDNRRQTKNDNRDADRSNEPTDCGPWGWHWRTDSVLFDDSSRAEVQAFTSHRRVWRTYEVLSEIRPPRCANPNSELRNSVHHPLRVTLVSRTGVCRQPGRFDVGIKPHL